MFIFFIFLSTKKIKAIFHTLPRLGHKAFSMFFKKAAFIWSILV